MELKTKRLRLIPLNAEQLEALCESREQCDAVLGLQPCGVKNDAHLTAAYREMLEACKAHPKEQLWFTCWLIVLREERMSIGSIGFFGCPNDKGEAELGYGIDEEYRNAGYASEALQKISDWAFGNGAYFLQAKTEPDNIPSRRVLEKNGFRQIAAAGEELLYEAEKPKSAWLSTYMCIGMSVGLCLGMSFDNMAIGMCIGLAIGVAVGASMDAAEQKKHKRE